MDAIEPVAETATMQHVQLMHGAKCYGTFLGSYQHARARGRTRAPCP